MLNNEGYVAEATGKYLFVRDGILYTPLFLPDFLMVSLGTVLLAWQRSEN